MEYTITHNTTNHRFETEVEGYKARIEYALRNSTISILHTWVPQPIGGRGIAAALTVYALEYAKQNNLSVLPVCSYTKTYITRHKEYLPLVKDGSL